MIDILLRRACRLALSAALATGAASACRAAEAVAPPPSASAAPQAAYRRVFVPADRPQDWPTDGQRYLPVASDQFQRLVAAAEERGQLAESGGVSIGAARHTLVLREDLTLAGRSRLEVNLIDSSPRILALAPCNVAVSNARWLRGDDGEEATFGLWPNPRGEADRYGILVEQSAPLLVEWTARPQSGAARDLAYRLQLPAAIAQELHIDLPPDCTVAVSPGRLAQRVERDGAVGWTFQLSQAGEHRVDIRRPGAAAPSTSTQPLAAVVESYGITPQGLEYEAQLRVQRRDAAADELKLTAPADMRIASVFVDRQEAAWTPSGAPGGEIVVPLPRTSAPVTVTVRGVAELRLDEPWRLPSLAAPDAFWTEGTSTLWIDPALELQSITPRLARLLNLVGVGGDAGGEAYRLQAWSREASTELIVAKRGAAMQAEVGVVAEFADRELAGRCQAHLWSAGGAALEVSAAIGPQWNVESVETTPADALAQWHVAEEQDQRTLHVQLRRSPDKQAPVRLAVSARKSLSGRGPAATLGELQWIRFRDVRLGGSFLVVRDRAGDVVQSDRPTLDGVQPLASLTARQRELLGDPPTGLLFAGERIDRDAAVRVVSTPVRFTGEAWIELARTSAGFEHRAEIACRPVAGAVSALTVAAARRLPADAEWTLVGGATPTVESPSSSAPPPAEGAAPAPVEYRVQLAQPMSEPFRLQVHWRGGATRTDAVNSLTLPGADDWQSWALLRGRPHEVRVEPRGCPPAAVPRIGDPQEAVLACFRLGDDPSTPLAAAPSLSAIDAEQAAAGGAVVCWRCDAATLQFADGNQSHRLIYHLEASAAHNVTLSLPKGYAFVAAKIDGEAAPRLDSAAAGGSIEIPLPAGRRWTTLTIDMRGRRRALDGAELVAPPLPQTSFPVIGGRWTVSAPAPYTVELEAARHAQAGWRQRLFGPLARSAGGAADGGFGVAAARAAAGSRAVDVNAGSATGALAVPYGWSSSAQEFSTAPPAVVIRRIDESRAVWHVSWLIAAVAAARLWTARPIWVTAAVALLAVACLIFPVEWIAVPQALLLGTLAGSIVREISIRTRRARAAALAAAHRATTVATLLALVASAASVAVDAAEVAPPPGVLIPIGADGRAAGGDVYVPETLLNELSPSAQKRRYDGAASLVTGVHHSVELFHAAELDEVLPGRCTVRLTVRTFLRDATLTLPISERETAEQAATIVLDDSPAPIEWTATGGTIKIAEPGVHRLSLATTPRAATAGDAHQIVLRGPAFPGARVEISHPPGLESLAVGDAHLAPSAESPSRTVASVTATESLDVSWSKRLRPTAGNVSVEQLTWLSIDPATARVEARLRVTGDLASLRTLKLAISPQLKLLPLPDDAPVQAVQTAAGSPTIVELKIQAPSPSPLLISLPLEVQRSVSLGRLDFPSIRVLGAETTRHHFAASVDRRLRIREEPAAGMTPAALPEIERLWGGLPGPAALQYVVASDEPVWSVNVEPPSPRFTAREALEVACTDRDAEVRYSAAIEIAEGERLSYRLVVPPALVVEQVRLALNADAGGAAIRWSRPRPDLLCVFISRPLSEPHTLHVAARLPYAAGRLPAPNMGLESTQTASIPMSVCRGGDVVVSWRDGAEPPPAAATGDSASGAIRVGQYSLPRAAAEAHVLEIADNVPRVSADVLLTLNLDAEAPECQATVRGAATGGVVDRVRLFADKNWRGPFLADATGVVTVTPSPQDAERVVIDVPLSQPVPAGREFSFKLSGAVALQPDQRMRFPQVSVLDADRQRTFLALPKTRAQQSAEWTLRGLQRRALPAELAEAAGAPPDAAAYQALRDRYLAEQRVFPEALRTASVRLAETRVALDDDGRWTAVTRLIVQPGAESDLAVEKGAGATLLYAAVDDQPLLPPAKSDGVLRIPPGPRYLPRLVTLAYRAPASAGRGAYTLEAPRIVIDGVPAPIARSLWQVDGDPQLHVSSGDGARPMTRRGFYSTVRQESIDAVSDASLLALQLPEWELHQWFRPWRDRLASTAAAPEAAATNEAAWRQLVQRVASLGGQDADAGQAPADAASRSAAAWFEGPADGQLKLASASTPLPWGRWTLALAIAGVGLAAWRRHDLVAKIVAAASRWPGVVGLLAGLAWWALLSPALLGPAIIIFSIAGLLKSWQQRMRLPQQPDATASAAASPG